MSEENIVLLSWDEPSKAYEAYSQFKNGDHGEARVAGIAVVERNAEGQLRVADGQDEAVGLGSLGGGALGAVVGILGGPLGVLLGFAGGAVIGSAFDLDRGLDVEGALGEMSRSIPPGRTALIAEVAEEDRAGLDDFARERGATLLRRPVEEVLDELAAAEEAADAAAAAAQEKVREAKKAERKEHREARVEKLKERFGRS